MWLYKKFEIVVKYILILAKLFLRKVVSKPLNWAWLYIPSLVVKMTLLSRPMSTDLYNELFIDETSSFLKVYLIQRFNNCMFILR